MFLGFNKEDKKACIDQIKLHVRLEKVVIDYDCDFLKDIECFDIYYGKKVCGIVFPDRPFHAIEFNSSKQHNQKLKQQFHQDSNGLLRFQEFTSFFHTVHDF